MVGGAHARHLSMCCSKCGGNTWQPMLTNLPRRKAKLNQGMEVEADIKKKKLDSKLTSAMCQ